MVLEQILNDILMTGPWLLFKTSMIVLLLLHLAFSFVIVRQTKLMTRVVEAEISSVIYNIILGHLLASVFVLIWTIIFL